MSIKLRGVGFIVTAAAVTLGLALPSAQADPTFTPDANDVVGVGSDTTEFVMQGLATGFNSSGVGGTVRLASFNATGSATIAPRTGAAAVTRPNGSSAGIDELQANPAVSFARSSRGPKTSGDEGTAFFPYAKDRLGYVYSKSKTKVRKKLGAAGLKAIYTCQKTNWNEFGGRPGRIKAKVPQAGSGTRSFFLDSIGVTEDELLDAIAQPNSSCNVAEVQEHDPAAVIGNKNAIAPFSFARYKTLPKKTKKKVAFATKAKFNVKRDVYNVVRASDAGSIGAMFDANSWICTSDAAEAIIKAQGFRRLPAGQCGVPVIA